MPSYFSANTFDYKGTKTVSFSLFGDRELGLADMLKTFTQDKAKISVTGKTSIIADALMPNVMVVINIDKNSKEKAVLVTLNAYVKAVAIKKISDKEEYRGYMPIFGRIFVLSDTTSVKEIESALSPYLKDLITKILAANQDKPEFFVILPAK